MKYEISRARKDIMGSRGLPRKKRILNSSSYFSRRILLFSSEEDVLVLVKE